MERKDISFGKELHIIDGSGHLLHLDYKKDDVFALLLDWFQRHLRPGQ